MLIFLATFLKAFAIHLVHLLPLLGLLVTGIVVASAVNSVSKAYARKFEFRAEEAGDRR